MPIAKFKAVFCCSSEDKSHPATNLLNEANKKWICEEIGLRSAYVTLQLESATLITGIDIGNENCAFVEVKVGKNSWPDDKFKNILPASSFMTPLEGRSSENKNRVRCFAKDDLFPVRDDKWDLVKIICTQPFNKHVQYGISFIKIHTNQATATESPAVQATNIDSPKAKVNCHDALKLPENNVFSQFRFRQDSSDSDKEAETSSSLFSKWKQAKTDDSVESKAMSPAAAIRKASASVSELTKCAVLNNSFDSFKPRTKHGGKTLADTNADVDKTPKAKATNRNRNSLMYNDEDENTSKPKLEQIISKDKERIQREKDESSKQKKDGGNKKPMGRDEKSRKKVEASSSKYNVFLDMDAKDGKGGSDKADRADTADKTDEEFDKEDGADESTTTTSPNSSQSKLSDTAPAPTDGVGTPKAAKKRRSSSNDRCEDTPTKRNKLLPSPATPAASPSSVAPTPARTPAPTASPLPASTATASPAPSPATEKTVPFYKLLQGVTFAISGIQNPDRADIRDKGLKMGAKYRPDWDNRCTHLICAFANTPKYKQVQGQGIIVNRTWLTECYAKKKKLPWQDFKL